MKKGIVFMAFIFFALCLSLAVAGAENKPLSLLKTTTNNADKQVSKKVYGYLEYDVVFRKMGLAEFPIDDPSQVKLNYINQDNLLGVGAYAQEMYYVFYIKQEGNNEISHSFGTIDVETGENLQICTYASSVPKMIDLSYDYSSSTMYGLQWKGQTSALITIDLSSGKISEIGTFKMQMKAIACTMKGQLFALGGDGNLYKINKTNAALTYVGNTGITPVSYHSIEFDHDTEKLYWSGAYFNTEGRAILYWSSIDTLNGTKSKLINFGNKSQIGGLYIPFNHTQIGAPDKIEQAEVNVSSTDLTKVDISWVNPSKASRGENLESLSGIKIYRDRVLIKTVLTTEMGKAQSYQDIDVPQGMHTYRLLPFNDKGDGIGQSLRCFVGKDAPGKVNNIKIENRNGLPYISWEKPQTGLNHGWCDTEGLKYEVFRFPDSVLVQQSAETELLDSGIKGLKGYWYRIVASNIQGKGVESYSERLAVGPAMILPFKNDFYNTDTFKLFTIVDANKDAQTWERAGSILLPTAKATYFCIGQSDDYLFMPPFNLKGDKYYKLSFDFAGYGPSNATNMRVVKGVQPYGTEFDSLADFPNTITDFTEKLHKNVIFKCAEDGVYYVGWHIYGIHGYSTTMYPPVSLHQIPGIDLAALKLSGNTFPNAQEESLFTVEVENRGALTQKEFDLILLDEANKVLARTSIKDSLPAEAKKKYRIGYTPTDVVNTVLRCVVALPQDEVAANDTSTKLSIKVQAAGDLTIIKVGEEQGKSIEIPFAFSEPYSYSQTIYNAYEMQRAGSIEKISLLNSFSVSTVKKVRIYMANILDTTNIKSLKPKSELSLVFEGEVSFPKGDNIVEINLNKTFLYNGDLLCVASENVGNTGLLSGVNKFVISYSAESDSKTIYRYDSTSEPLKTEQFPDMVFGMQTKNGGGLSGKVLFNGEPASAVNVFIPKYSINKTTDENGLYAFSYLPTGTYNVVFSKFGYSDKDVEITIKKGETTVSDVSLIKRPKYRVNGVVKDLDQNLIPEAEVFLSGYDTAKTTTNANGEFVFEQVYGSAEYVLGVKHFAYKEFNKTINVPDKDFSVGVLNLQDNPFPMYKVNAVERNGKVGISWVDMKTPMGKDCIIDDGSFENGTRHNPNAAYMMGNKFPSTDSGVISHVSVYGIKEATAIPGIKVGIYIFNKNREIILSNIPVEIPAGKWVDVPVGNVPFNGDFYVLLSWQKTNGVTNWIARDENGPYAEMGLDYEYSIKYNIWRPAAEGGLHPGVFSIRAKTIVETATTVASAASATASAASAATASTTTASTIATATTVAPAATTTATAAHISTAASTAAYTKSVQKIKIYRLESANKNEEETWELLSEVSAAQNAFEDNAFASLSQGVYEYAVKKVYSGIDNISAPSFSNKVYKDMLTSLSIAVNTNTETNEADGAAITLSNRNDFANVVAGTVKNGVFKVDTVVKGLYDLVIEKEGFYTKEEKIDISEKNSYELTYILNEKVIAPKSLKIENTSKPENKEFYWNTNKMIFDDFESHPDFEVNSPGSIKWTYIDADNSLTEKIPGATYPHIGEKMAYMIMNPYNTTPSLMIGESANAAPYSGQKYLAGIAATDGPNADYIISPKLFYTENFFLVFVAKSFGYAYGNETIEVGVSQKTDDIKDFTFKKVELYQSWSLVSYIMPKTVRYICIKYTSDNKMMAMIDDFYTGIEDPLSGSYLQSRPIPEFEDENANYIQIPAPKDGFMPNVINNATKSFQKYEVFLDDIKVAETNDENYEFKDLSNGRHTAGVRSVYSSGKSSITAISFNVSVNSELENKESGIKVYPNPANEVLHIDGDYDKAELIDLNGRVLKFISAKTAEINTTKWPEGIYVLKTYKGKEVGINKVIIKH